MYIAPPKIEPSDTYLVTAITAIAIQLVCVVIIGGLLIARHHANIKRLLSGTENKLGAKKGEVK